MRRVILVLLIAFTAFAADGVSGVQAVYLLPMGNALDQYLAQRLTKDGVVSVVTDPKLADALLTDQIGLAFERRFAELYPPPAAPLSDDSSKKIGLTEEQTRLSQQLKRESDFRPTSTFQRGRGNLFLVDVKSKRVLWSIYEPPKSTRSNELEKASGRIAEQLRKDLGRK
jgi:hypothetical protein